MLKKILSIVLTLTLLLSLLTMAYADTSDEEKIINPGAKLTYISSTATNLEINAIGKACCYGDVDCYSSVDSVKISGYLQKYVNGSWSTVKHWTKSTSGTYGYMYEEYYVTSGYQYRWKVYYYAYSGSSSERVYDIDTEYY